jgi:signal transduction histidine kinase/DNA-binding response OmpR family regulator/ligand-binding sensor domain-containing protein
LFAFFLLIISLIGNAQIKLSDFNNFNHYTEENGLASKYISAIQEDKHGFLWIATGKGITRYDGNHFTNFTSYYLDSIKHDLGPVSCLTIDKSGEHIWFGVNDGIFHSSVDKVDFQKIDKLIPSLTSSLPKVSDIFLDANDILWVANQTKGLERIDITGNKFDSFTFTNALQNDNYGLNTIHCIAKAPNDNVYLWLGTSDGLIRFNRISKVYQLFVFNDDPQLPQNSIRKIYVSEDEVFLGTWSQGLIVFNKKSKQFKQVLADSYPNSHLLVLDIFKDKESGIWITTGNGLIQYDALTKKVIKVIWHGRPEGKLKGVSLIDSRGIIWYCDAKGLFKYDPLQSQNTFIELERRSGVQDPLLIRKIILWKDYIYVLGHSSSGLYKINRTDFSFETINPHPFNYLKNKQFSLRDMLVMENGNFLVISGKKISVFNPKTHEFKLTSQQPGHPNPSLQTIVKDRNSNYWIGSRAGGLYCFDIAKNSIKNYKEEFNIFKEGNHEWILHLFIDSKNKLWMGKGSSTLMDLDDFAIHCIDPKDSINSYHDVGGFLEDGKGRVWMAGFKDGIGFTDFDHFQKGVTTMVKGYFSGLYPYNDSLVWTTGGNLGIFNINSFSYQEIKLSSNNRKLKISGPVTHAGNGEYIIGCNNGVLIYNPEKQFVNEEIPSPYVREVECDGKTFYEGNSFAINNFEFKSGTKHLVFKVSSLGFHFSDQITYRYKLGGGWQNVGSGQEINLMNLPHGEHKLEIKAFNNRGISNEMPITYNITILTPWWNTWWAYLIYLGIAVLFADRFYRFQLSKRLAVAESERLKEVNQLRNSLYTNITHEFRTPLTVILGMVDSITSTIKVKHLKAAEQSLEMIRRNGKNLLRLVNEMLDLSKLESGNMDLQLIQADVIPFVKYLSESFHSLAHEKQINLMVYSEIDGLVMDFDVNKLSAVISNILSNAIKFTQPGGKIVVHLNQIAKDSKEFFFIKIKDNGQGISEEETENIFNRFYQVDNSSSRRGEGTGIGLALSREFVELMNGSIEVKSSLGKGSEFIVQLPINNEAPQTKNVHEQLEPNISASVSNTELTEPTPDDQSELPLALIIEDNKDVAHYLKTCLTGKYQTAHAENGEIGIEMAFDKVPDIIICDVMMPLKDGFEVCSELKSDERSDHIPIIMLTAKVTMKDKLIGLSCGADAYLTKPFIKAELLTRLDQLVLLRKKIMQKFNNDSLNHFLKIKAENPETKFLQKIIKIIHEEISNHSFGSSLHLSRKMQLSESQIYRKLKAITGKSTAVFIRSVRLQKAKELIQTTDKTISEIAYDVGFNDPSWFGRAFKEEFGFAPSDISK